MADFSASKRPESMVILLGVAVVVIATSWSFAGAQIADPIAGIACINTYDSSSYDQIVVTRSGNTLVSGYRWPAQQQRTWVPGPNLFAVAGAGGSVVADVSGSAVLTEDGTILVCCWSAAGNIAASAGDPSPGRFVGFWSGGLWNGQYIYGGAANFPFAITDLGKIFRLGNSGAWEIAGTVGDPTSVIGQSWGELKTRYH